LAGHFGSGNDVRVWGSVAASLAMMSVAAFAADAPQASVTRYDPVFFTDARPNTAYDMIGRLPGFTFVNVNSARGFAGTAGNVLIDGQRPTSKSDDLQSILTRIPASDVDHIDVIRGSAQGLDMQGQTVVANVIRKTGSTSQWVLDLQDNIFKDGHTVPSASLNYTGHDGPTTYEFSLARYAGFDDSVGWGFHKFTEFNPDGSVADVILERAHTTGQGSGGGATGAITTPLWSGTFKVNLALQDSPFYSTATYYDPVLGNRYITDDNVGRNIELGLHWNGQFGPFQDETLILERIGFSKDVNASDQPGDDELFRSSSTTDESIFRETLRYPFSERLNVRAGGEFAYNSLNGDTGFIDNGVAQLLPDARAHVDEKRGEVFAQATWKVMPDWTLEAGARAEYSLISEESDTEQSRSFFYPKPRAVLTWSPAPDDQVRLRAEKIVGQLDFGNFIATGNLGGSGVTSGNSDLRPDQRWQYEASYEHHFWGKGAIVFQFIHEQITDVVDFVPVTNQNGDVFDAPGNIGSGRNDQFNLKVMLPLDKLWIPGGLLTTTTNFQFSAVRDPVTGQNRVISGERPQDIEVNFTQDLPNLKSTWGLFYYNCWMEDYFRLEQLQHRKTVPPYIEAFWEYKPTPNWSFHLGLINIGRFVYDNTFYDFDGPRNIAPLLDSDERSIKSQPRVYIEIRKTF
jgi:outer membrane receptor protein involved in Fe transport